ncbi:MAG: DUF885 family protein [Clostridia bacterium]
MKKRMRIIALMLSAMIAFSVIGCVPQEITAEEPVTIAMTTQEPAATLEPLTAPPTPTPDAHASEKFSALDLEVFRWYATNDGYSFHSLISDPSVFQIDRAMVTMNLGEFTEEDSKRYSLQAASYLEQLLRIPRMALTEREQFSYDVMQQFLEEMADDTNYEYYYEPLTEFSGIHADLPLMLALFEMHSEQDIQDYLSLLADVPRYFGQVLAYEQERASRGMFMTEDALDAILKGCKSIIDSRRNSFLYATFNEAVDNIEGLPPEQVKDFKQRNTALIKNEFIDAYVALYDGLKALRKSCREPEGMHALGEKATAYFELMLQSEGNNQLSVEETLELLKNELYFMYATSAEIQQNNPKVWNAATDLTSGKTDTDLEQLKAIAAEILPALPDDTMLTISAVPEELESMMSPACYVIPPIDAWKDNKVFINTANEDSTLFLTLAHETYPGHMYQYVYQRGLPDLGVTQRVLHYSGYAEGWAQLSEYLAAQNQNVYDKDYCTLMFYNNMLSSAIIPAVVSILVNCYSYSKESVKTFLSGLGLTDEAYTDSYFNLAVNQPYYTFSYAIGYSQLMSLLRDAQTDLGDSFDQKNFLKTYLDFGPCYFNLVKERMDIWVDQQMMEEA